MENNQLLVVLGATASGKTKLAVALAKALDGEIISADSRQIFRRMDIGTGKDLQEYEIEGQKIPYHLIDILEPGARYHVDAFKEDFYAAFESIQSRNKTPVLCGGTGMYIHSILQHQPYTAIPVNEDLRKSLDSVEKNDLIERLHQYTEFDAHKVDLSSAKRLVRAIEIADYLKYNSLQEIKRPEIKPVVFGLKNEVAVTWSNILKRLEERLNAGMIEEVERLIQEGTDPEMLAFYGLEYKFVVHYLSGLLSREEMKNRLGIAICQYAKRQNTFFRKMEKDGVLIHWLDASRPLNLLKQQVLENV